MEKRVDKSTSDKIKNKTTILKVIVGSVAHGLATKDSDTDYRGVFVVSTSELLKIGSKISQTNWISENIDDTAWEVGKFLLMATKCNPTVLEVFLAPVVFMDNVGGASPGGNHCWGNGLRELFPYVWNSEGVMKAFIGYGLNQRKKFLDNKDQRPHKYAVAYLRTLYQAWELLSTGTFTIKVGETGVGDTLRRFKSGEYTVGEVIETCIDWETKVRKAYEKNPNKKTNLRVVNDFLIRLRKEFW